jgi:hypothetical protein
MPTLGIAKMSGFWNQWNLAKFNVASAVPCLPDEDRIHIVDGEKVLVRFPLLNDKTLKALMDCTWWLDLPPLLPTPTRNAKERERDKALEENRTYAAGAGHCDPYPCEVVTSTTGTGKGKKLVAMEEKEVILCKKLLVAWAEAIEGMNPTSSSTGSRAQSPYKLEANGDIVRRVQAPPTLATPVPPPT